MSRLSTQWNLLLPDHWIPEQALAAYPLLNDLADSIWNRYECHRVAPLTPELNPDDASQPDRFGFDDPLPL
jgi:hypothetical protein